MRDENVIEVKNITKSFKVYLDKGSTIKEKIVSQKRRKYEERRVLRGISFELKRGEAIGLIGHNGCGKSTILKLLAKIMYPDTGIIEMKGRVSSLLELGAGFHPDMSGRENIYINASIFGLSRKEIDERLDDIIAFSELEEFIENPVRTYSSGMYMRLAFAVAINVGADILLIDEILAVGDAAFQAKCFNKLKEIKAEGTTIVIVSHSLAQIEEICEKSIWIHKGLIREQGNPKDVHKKYQEYVLEKRVEVADKELQRKMMKKEKQEKSQNTVEELNRQAQERIDNLKKKKDKDIEILNVKMFNAYEKEKNIFYTGEKAYIDIYFKTNAACSVYFAVGIMRLDGVLCCSIKMRYEETETFEVCKDGVVRLMLEDLSIMPNLYVMDVAVEDQKGNVIEYMQGAYRFEMISNHYCEGITSLKHSWILE